MNQQIVHVCEIIRSRSDMSFSDIPSAIVITFLNSIRRSSQKTQDATVSEFLLYHKHIKIFNYTIAVLLFTRLLL